MATTKSRKTAYIVELDRRDEEAVEVDMSNPFSTQLFEANGDDNDALEEFIRSASERGVNVYLVDPSTDIGRYSDEDDERDRIEAASIAAIKLAKKLLKKAGYKIESCTAAEVMTEARRHS